LVTQVQHRRAISHLALLINILLQDGEKARRWATAALASQPIEVIHHIPTSTNTTRQHRPFHPCELQITTITSLVTRNDLHRLFSPT
jgi:hypothetical protein